MNQSSQSQPIGPSAQWLINMALAEWLDAKRALTMAHEAYMLDPLTMPRLYAAQQAIKVATDRKDWAEKTLRNWLREPK